MTIKKRNVYKNLYAFVGFIATLNLGHLEPWIWDRYAAPKRRLTNEPTRLSYLQ